jgi:tetratricopeptide (TPR) repeat protein
MKKLLILLVAILLFLASFAQKKTTIPAMPDMNAIMKMTPAEREAYKQKMIKESTKQAEQIAKDYNLNVNTAVLPGYESKPPVKDIKRLALIPSRPPTRTELVSEIQNSMAVVRKGIPPPRIEQIQQFTTNVKVEKIHDAAVTSFYNNNPEEGVYLAMMAAKEAPDSALFLNNLGAMLNMVNVQHKAVPILQYALQKFPESSTILNNLGQSFFGLGDLFKAAEYLNRCLSVDSLNIEANHSMGMLHVFKKEYDQAMKYFNREMSQAMRASTMAEAYRMGKKFDLTVMAKRKHARSGAPDKDFFEEINLGKFKMPDMPGTALEAKMNKPIYESFGAAVQSEMLFWSNNAQQVNMAYTASDGDKYPGVYHALVQAMLDELSDEHPAGYLNYYPKEDAEITKEIIDKYSRLLIQVKCEIPPGLSIEAQEAYERKCCEEKRRPIADKLVSELSGHITPILKKGQGRWKSYINQLIAIVQMDPSAANQMLVYNAVSGYFNHLSWGMLFYSSEINNLLPECADDYNPQEIDSIIESDRKWRLDCPAWLNIEINLEGAAVKMDCNKYVIETGEVLMAAFEHEFKSGKSTLLFGSGMKGGLFGDIVKVETKGQFFLSFDNNKQFSDFGWKNTSEVSISGTPIPFRKVKIGGNAMGVEISNSISINGGMNSDIERKGAFNLF